LYRLPLLYALPSGVDIPGVFAAWNLHASATPGSVQKARRLYKELIEKMPMPVTVWNVVPAKSPVHSIYRLLPTSSELALH
jgi:hypothetical protein